MKNILGFLAVVFCLITTTNPLLAQWIQTNIPNWGAINCFAVNGTNLFAGTGGGVLLSTNNGTSWTAVNTGLTNVGIQTLAFSGTNLFAGTGGGVFLSTNNGTSWTAINNGLTERGISSFAVIGTNLFAGTHGYLFRSTNNGTSWTAVNTPGHILVLAASGMNLFAGSGNGSGVNLSTNNGTSWTVVNNGLPTGTEISSLVISGTNLFAGSTIDGVFLSTNNGTSWTAINSGLAVYAVRSLAVSGTNLFIGMGYSGGVFRSTNNGTSWTAVYMGLDGNNVQSLFGNGMYLFAGTSEGRVWRRPLSEMITSVERVSSDLPTHFSLDQNYPNPFNPSTTISFSLPSKSFVSLKVFDALGRQVALLRSEELPAGTYTQQWNTVGLASGIYFYRLQAGLFTETKKLNILR